jgi:hypothetical protein
VDEEPSGYFNSATEEALKRWQLANGITRSPGLFGVPGRALYAKARGSDVTWPRTLWTLPPFTPADAPRVTLCVPQKHGFPLPDSGRVFPDTTEAEDDKTCIDVCAEFAGQQDCQTRCVRRVAEEHSPGLAPSGEAH